LDPECELKMPFLKSAFKRMLPDEMNKHMENNMQGKDFGEIKQFMYDWAVKKRQAWRESHKSKHMDTSGVDQQWPSPDSYDAGNLGQG